MSISSVPFRLWRQILLLPVLLTLLSCHYAHEDDTWVSANGSRPDSADFRRTHHYWKGYNFVATDTFSLSVTVPFETGELRHSVVPEPVRKGETLVVEDIRLSTAPEDTNTVWLRITAVELSPSASRPLPPRHSSGWVTETSLRQCTVPDTPVSKIIHTLGSRTFKLGLVLSACALAVLLLLFRRHTALRLRTPASGYRNLLEAVLAASVVIHRAIWFHTPEQWVEYYYHPTLLPFASPHPVSVGLFISAVWLLILLAIALADDVFRSAFTLSQAIGMLIASTVRSTVIFAIFAVVLPYCVTWPVLVLFIVWLVHDYRTRLY